MTVKCLSHQDKYDIAMLYVAKTMNTEELAQAYCVSKRTINRVTVEMGVNKVRVVKRKDKVAAIVSDPVPVSKPVELPIEMIELSFIEKVQCMFKAIFWRTPKNNNAQSRP